ncbi:cytochrome c oxidase subunit 6b-1 [Phtheirospermum japonicum]|uniref:Cytochrome c oxidase subunit 6b-1 n=1 Tax=Phtheirospermum japonicum TaxID=374723 RepID=A0A830C8K2_9LAMI|nr:cytochrome c oxidase subunit 6b-1 [Phtheirospermum japonicum]
MAEVEASKLPSLAEHYLVEEKEQKPEVAAKSVEEVKPSSETTAEEIVAKIEETLSHGASEVVAPPPAEEEESKESSPAADETADNADNDSAEPENSDNQEPEEETPEIKLETAPADFRTYKIVEVGLGRCVAAKGEGAPECDKFAKYYRSLCPGEWVDRWNEQRENGTFPGPL